MTNRIVLLGVESLGEPETRALLHLEVTVDDRVYSWQVFYPLSATTYDEYLASISSQIYADIANKEAAWEALTPKTRLVEEFGEGMREIPITKDEIVRPDIPDYYAKRRAAYPSIGDQLDAFWKGPDSPAYTEMLARIQAVKLQYPKPTV